MPPDESLRSRTTAESHSARFDVFLSHNSRDKPFVERLAEKLKRAGLEPWLDKWCLVAGARWQQGISEGLSASASCAVFVGPSDLGAWEQLEMEEALNQAAQDPDFRVFLVLLPGVPDPLQTERLPPFLRTRTWVDLRRGLGDARALQAVIDAVKGIPPGPEVPIEARAGVCPYRGLQVFDEEHADFFFGRDAESQRLLEAMKGTRFLAVVGASGSGKSSLVRAGLIPALRRGDVPGSERWAIAVLTPGARPLETLAARLLRLAADGPMQRTLERLDSDPRTLHLAAALACADAPRHARILWVVDQFEELFTLCRDDRQRSAFVANVVYAASIPGGSCAAVLTMRADFYHRCLAYPELAQQLAAYQFAVSPMDAARLRQVIEEPARRVALELEPGLVSTILEDVAEQPGGLPQLEHALVELWERRAGNTLTLAGYRESDGVRGAIAKRADDVFASFTRDQREIARRTLLRLTQPGDGTEDTRRRAPLNELATRGARRDDVEAVVRTLVDAHLLTTGTDEAQMGEPWVDVAHEALIRGWPRLQGWIDEDRIGLRVHRRLTEAARDWARHDRDESLLYRGPLLAQAAVWRERNEQSLNELERTFLDASSQLRDRETREAEERRQKELASARQLASAQRRAKRRLLWVAGVLLVGLLAAGIAAWKADQASNRAHSRELAAKSRLARSEDPARALVFALEAMSEEHTTDAEAALRRSLLSPLRVILPHGGRVASAAFSPNGRLVVTGGNDGTARVWDAVSGRERLVLRAHDDGVTSVAFSPDGRRVLTASLDGTARIADATGGRQLAVLRHDAAPWSASFSSDGGLIVTAHSDGTARIWDATDARERVVLRGHADVLISGVFSADSSRIVTTSFDGTARIWKVASGEELAVLRHAQTVNSAVFSPDGRLVVTASDDRTARIWEAAGGKQLAVLRGHRGAVESAAFSPDGNRLVTSGVDRTARIWQAASGRQVAVLRHSGEVRSAAFSPDGERVLTAGADGTARVWQAVDRERPTVLRHAGGVECAAFSPDGKLIATAGSDDARIWQVAGGEQLIVLGNRARGFGCPVFSPNGKLVVTVGVDRLARIWRVTSGEQVKVLRGHEKIVRSASFSRNGKRVVTAGDDGVRIWQVTSGKELDRAWSLSGSRSATFSPDGRLVVTADDLATRIWNPASDRVELLAGGSDFRTAAFSPDGKLVVAGSDDGTARIWDAHSKRQIVLLAGHTGVVRNAAFSPDRGLVVTASDDRTARIWQASSGEPLAVLRGHTERVATGAFSPDGKRILTASLDGTALVHLCVVCGSVNDVLARAEEISGMTPSQRDTFLRSTENS